MNKFLIKKPDSIFIPKPSKSTLKKYFWGFILIVVFGFTLNYWINSKMQTIYAQETVDINKPIESVKGAYTTFLENTDKSADTLLFEGMNLVEKNHFDIAIMTLEKAVTKDPNYRDAALYTGYVYLKITEDQRLKTEDRNSDLQKAKFYLEKARAIDPLYAKTHELLGYTYLQLGNAENAALCYNKSKALEHGNATDEDTE